MPVSKAQRTKLDRAVRAHAREMRGLQDVLKALDIELERRDAGEWSDPNPKPEGIAGLRDERDLIALHLERHLALMELARNERWIAVLDELLENPELVEKAAPDPRAFAKSRGIALPKTMDLEIGHVHGHPRVRVVNYDAQTPFTLVWDRRGFTFAE